MASAGRGARQRGHKYEVTVANYLTANTKTEVKTTRAVCKGARADLATFNTEHRIWVPTVQDWSLELKSTDRWEPEKWLKQARDQRDRVVPFAVIADVKHKPVGDSWVIEPWPDGYGWWMTTLDQWTDRNLA